MSSARIRPLATAWLSVVAPLLLSLACSRGPARPCVPVRDGPPQKGTQGWRIWSGPTLRTFSHGRQVICVPEGWEPVGEEQAGRGWARFPLRQTGVLVRSDAFSSRVTHFANTRFPVEIVWPTATPGVRLEAFDRMIEHAFVEVGALYPRLPDELAGLHTVLITAGVAGDTRSYDGRIYPEPGPNLSVVVRTPDQWRAEELFLHAVAHLYNRHRVHWIGDQKEKLPIPERDWQEIVASWTETAFLSSQRGRLSRLEYLNDLHAAIQTGELSRIHGQPFRPEEFARVHRDVAVAPGSPEIDYHYAHYFLGPLSMVATEGLLAELARQGTIRPTSVAALLTEVHEGKHDSYFAALEEVLPPAEMRRVLSWMHAGATIPRRLVFEGAAVYADGSATSAPSF